MLANYFFAIFRHWHHSSCAAAHMVELIVDPKTKYERIAICETLFHVIYVHAHLSSGCRDIVCSLIVTLLRWFLENHAWIIRPRIL